MRNGGIMKGKLNSDIGDNVILIKDADNQKGEFFIESAGSWITLGGSGINGPYKAAQYLIDTIDGHADAEIDSVKAPLVTLEGSLDLIKEGRINIGFIGDSVTFGHGPVTPWPTYFIESMQKAYPDAEFRYENVAVSGKKSTWAAENIKKLLLKKKLADIVFVAIGTNDKYQQGALSPVLGEQTKANYVSIIDQIKDANPNAQIVFVLCSRDYEMKGIVGVGGEVSPYIDAMLEVSDEYGIPIIDPMSALYDACEEYAPGNAMGNGWRYYMQDEVHPNAEGQHLYADVVFKHIKAALQQ
jgi:lysophospholipase L1-like esterase